ncbi:hypothetical protein PENTCL1PPCAC_19817 [Pristionchus entomophagus]|uniref:Glutathione S-transferase n=1 Tax=Pristionchus entomophagus TaxID=358040 RepID=A0AAV5TTU8_9BILA|nr:hypothetical protein PENTCL1PPCAC_19817 [Pristionchus entomophagus]
MPEPKHTYRLVYFDAEGRGEPVRLLFTYFGVPFEDVRLTKEEWAEKKKDAPFETAPILEIDGGKKVLGDSLAISRFLAKTLGSDGFIGKTKSDAAKADAFVYSSVDVFMPIYLVHMAKSDEEKVNAMTFLDTAVARYLRSIEKHLKAHESPYVLSHGITWADIYVLFVVHTLENLKAEYIDKDEYPHVLAHYSKMRNHPKLKDYIEEKWQSKIL